MAAGAARTAAVSGVGGGALSTAPAARDGSAAGTTLLRPGAARAAAGGASGLLAAAVPAAAGLQSAAALAASASAAALADASWYHSLGGRMRMHTSSPSTARFCSLKPYTVEREREISSLQLQVQRGISSGDDCGVLARAYDLTPLLAGERRTQSMKLPARNCCPACGCLHITVAVRQLSLSSSGAHPHEDVGGQAGQGAEALRWDKRGSGNSRKRVTHEQK